MSGTLKNNFRQITFRQQEGEEEVTADMTWGEIPAGKKFPHKRKYDSKSKQHALCNKSSARGLTFLGFSANALCQPKKENIKLIDFAGE